MIISQRIYLFMLCLTLSGMLKAQESKQEPAEKELDPIVVTGTGTHQRLKSTAVPVNVITAAELKKTGISDFQQALSMAVPQLSFTPNAMGSNLMMNGLSNKYVLILLNGHKLVGDVSNNVDLSRIDLSRVKRVEVLNGAGSSIYGSDAIAGVINIITNDPQDEISLTSQSRVSGKGQFTENVNLNIAKGIFGSQTSYKHDRSDGWQNSPLAYIIKNAEIQGTQESLYPLSAGFHSNMVNQKFTLTASEKLSLYAGGNYYRRITDRPAKEKGKAGGFNYDLHYESWRFEAGGLYKFSRRNSLQFDFTADDYDQRHKYIEDYSSYKAGEYAFSKNQKFYDGELRGVFHFTANSTTVFGTDIKQEELRASSGNVEGTAYTISGYAQHEAHWQDWKAIVGARYDYHETAGSHFSPKLSLMYALGNLNLRGTYSHGFIAPQLNELYYKYFNDRSGRRPDLAIGNKNLKPGSSNYFSLNAEYHTNKFSASVTGYLNYLNDMITKKSYPIDAATLTWAQQNLDITEDQLNRIERYTLYVNFDRAIIRGLQFDVMANLFSGFSISGNYNLTYARGKIDGEWQNIEKSIRHTGTVNANYQYMWKHYTLNVNLNGRMQSKRYFPGEDNAPGYGIWNFNTRHTFDVSRHLIMEPSLGVDNIFDKKDTRPYGMNVALLSPGRMLVGGLTLKFK